MKCTAQQQDGLLQLQVLAQARREGIQLTPGQVLLKVEQFFELQEHHGLIVRH